MNEKKVKRGCAIALAAYILLAAVFNWVCGDQLRFRDEQTDMLSASGVIGEITSDTVVTQRIQVDGDRLLGLTLYGATYARQNTGWLCVEICLGEQVLATRNVDVSTMADNSAFYLGLEGPADIPEDGSLILRITAPESVPGNAVTLYSGRTMAAAHAEVDMSLTEEECVHINGVALDTALCTQLLSREDLWFGQYYWYVAAAGLLVLAIYCLVLMLRNKAGKRSLVLNMFAAFTRYRYLMKQLVARDFKTKYKRSVLGVLWSFLNPLLTMVVQYIVFSTLFRSDIPNFALYLLTGIVCFNFFSEATTMALGSIVNNAPLITKVYVPKYIYPLTRVMSSAVNFLLALIPLFAVMLITGTPVRVSILLMPAGLLCLFAVSLGIGMLLASAMVFFRDTQFLWGVVSMLWMYATPIFYPESIIPASFMTLYKCNPLYHIIRFIRIVLMDGISPEPKAYALMAIASFVPLALGVLVFKRTQDRFVLHI